MCDEVGDAVESVEQVEDRCQTQPDEDGTCGYKLKCPRCGQESAVENLLLCAIVDCHGALNGQLYAMGSA